MTLNAAAPTTKAVLFDLDDTLFDHRYSCRTGLDAVRRTHAALRARSLDELEAVYYRSLNELHALVLEGQLTLEMARVERFRRLFTHFGDGDAIPAPEPVAAAYHAAYRAARRAVPGALPLLRALQPRVQVAVITNNLGAEQREKLRICKLDAWFDVVVISEEVGVTKPDPAIFAMTLERLGCDPVDAIMVGDSWESDIVGATNVGMRAVWLNRYQHPCPDARLAAEIDALEPTDRLLDLLLDSSG